MNAQPVIDVERLIREAHSILLAGRTQVSPSRVSNLVRSYRKVAHQMAFFDYFVSNVAMQRTPALAELERLMKQPPSRLANRVKHVSGGEDLR